MVEMGKGPTGISLMFVLTWDFVSVLLLLDLAFRVLVILSGSSPNLQDKRRGFQYMNRKEPRTNLTELLPDLTGC